MNLIALFVGLLIERLATQLFHWRRMRWTERIIDAGFRRAERISTWPALIPVILLAVVLVLPVFVVTLLLRDADALLGFPYVILAIVVLFFSLGPKDIGEDVDDYCAALEEGDEEKILHTAKSLIESDVPDDPQARTEKVEAAVFVQANNRLFAIIFWFVALGPLGPLGAWAYRVTDLVRRRAVFNAVRDDGESGTAGRIRDAAVLVHGWLAWIPARLSAIGYAVAGHFDGALAGWRTPRDGDVSSTFVASQLLLARVGVGALALGDDDEVEESLHARGIRGAKAARRLVVRSLLVWVVVIAAMTLYGWTV